MQGHVDLVGVAGQGLVDAVVDDLLGEVVGSRGVGVHARALSHGLKPRKDLDVFGGILAHCNGFLILEIENVPIRRIGYTLPA